MENLASQIENQLRNLKGLSLAFPARAHNLLVLHFGQTFQVAMPKGRTKVVGEYALHVQCPWRFIGQVELITGSADLKFPPGGIDVENFDWSTGPNQCDDKLQRIVSSLNLVVGEVTVDRFGGFNLNFIDDYSLQVFPDSSLPVENWRLFKPSVDFSQYQDQPHFVLLGNCIELE